MDGIGGKLPKATLVKNKQAGSVQITAEQLLRESRALQLEDGFKSTRTIITDKAELDDYRLRERTNYENYVRRTGRAEAKIWLQYAQFEEAQKDFRRARSVWERALQIRHRNVAMWINYAEMEMRNRFVNHARNVWDRAVTMLPRVDKLWQKYVQMEEMLGAIPAARAIYERWMVFEPDQATWMMYVNFEKRYDEVERARGIFERYVLCHPGVRAYVRYAHFEMGAGNPSMARAVFERAVVDLEDDGRSHWLFVPFAEFEEKAGEPERARAIYKYALDRVPKAQAEGIYKRFVKFEKTYGDREGIEAVISSRKRFEYDDGVRREPWNYDLWFDYIRLEEAAGEVERTRQVYDRAVAQLPPAAEKRLWMRYIYLWINWAVWEELEGGGAEQAREVYRRALAAVPHKNWTFAKLWILAAQLEVRQKDLGAARKLLGHAIGVAPKNKTFCAYIDLEQQLGEVGRCRTLLAKYVEWDPSNHKAWSKWTELESQLGETERVRGLYQLAISQPVLDAPEVLWKAAIDFEVSEKRREAARALYEQLLTRTQHVKVWLSYAAFEATPEALLGVEGDDGEEEDAAEARRAQAAEAETDADRSAREATTRGVFERGYRSLRENNPGAKEEAVMLLEAWKDFEGQLGGGDAAHREVALSEVQKKMPKRVKRKRALTLEDGTPAGMEEYYDYIFPEEENQNKGLKLLQAAQRWKKQKLAQEGG